MDWVAVLSEQVLAKEILWHALTNPGKIGSVNFSFCAGLQKTHFLI